MKAKDDCLFVEAVSHRYRTGLPWPTSSHLPVVRYVPPEDFNCYREVELQQGFLEVVSGPLVRSSYRAERALEKNNVGLGAD